MPPETDDLDARLTLLAEAADTLLRLLNTEAVVSTLLELSQRLLAADAYAVWRHFPEEHAWRVVADANLSPEYCRITPEAAGQVLPAEPFNVEDVFGAPLLAVRRAEYETEGIRSLLCVPLRIRGEEAGTIVFYFHSPHTTDAGELRLAGTLGALAAAALTNAELYAEQARLRAAAEVAEARQAFLSEAGAVLAASLDYDRTLQQVAELVVPRLADWCVMHLRQPDGEIRPVALAHTDPEKVRWSRELSRRYPVDPAQPHGVPEVMRTGKPEFYPEITEELLVRGARDPEHLEILRQVGFTACVICPLRGREEVLGALTMVSAESGIRYDEAHLQLTMALADRAATAIENSRSYHEAQQARAEAEAAAAALRAEEARFHAFMANSPTSAWITDADGRILYVSPTYRRTFGVPEGDLLGKGPFDLYPEELARQYQENIRRVAETGTVVEAIEPSVRTDGSAGEFLVYKFPVAGVRGEIAVGGVAVDLTERNRAEAALRRSEQEFRLLADAMPQIVWTALPDGTPTYYNRRWFEYVGRETNVLSPEGVDRAVHPEDVPGVYAEWRRATSAGSAFEWEYRLRHAETGEYRWHLGRAVPVRTRAGSVEKWFGTATDIHVQKMAQEALREADRKKDEFLATLAHELRNPLAAISNALVLLAERCAGEPRLDEIQALIGRQSAYLGRLVDDLLDVSRIERGLVELRRERLELTGVVTRAVEATRPLIESRGHELTLVTAPEALHVHADALRLEQVVVNFLTNAARYTESGGQVRVVVERRGEEAVVRVRDTGIGISPETLPHVFDLFVQADRSHARTHGGLGIGLHIVKRLVEMHAGWVSVESAGPGYGSEFSAWFPVAEGTAPAAPRPEGPAVIAGGSRRILVVDDNRDAAETLGELLQLAGHEVTLAASGPEGVERARETLPEVILCDIGLPGMDGYQVARELREDPLTSGIRLLALTGFSGEEDRRQALEAGFELHLTKPLEFQDLLRILA